MTTGIEYNTKFISLRPDEETRSITELVEIERTDGYSGMTDKEISNLIEYKQYIAMQAKQLEIMQDETNKRIEALKDDLEKQREFNEKFVHEILIKESVFETIEDDGSM